MSLACSSRNVMDLSLKRHGLGISRWSVFKSIKVFSQLQTFYHSLNDIYICWVCYWDFTQFESFYKAVSNTLKLLPACSSTPASRPWPSKARDYLQSFVSYRSLPSLHFLRTITFLAPKLHGNACYIMFGKWGSYSLDAVASTFPIIVSV